MLAGLLHPTAGVGRVLDYEPWQRNRDFLKAITLVMGQRNQLNWDIPASDSFELNRVIYRVPLDDFRKTLAELTELPELGPLISKPVRNLSLGERMKCEIAAALLHRPRVLFLDEPTIGLDVTAQRRIREFIRAYNGRHGATILLTSHYMADVEALCPRVVVIHHGRILFDGLLADLVTRFSPHKTIGVDLEHRVEGVNFADFGEVVSQTEGRVLLRVPKLDTAKVASRLSTQLSPLHALGFGVALLAGGAIVYSFWLILATAAFWFVKTENILVIFQAMYQAGRWPVTIYPVWLQTILTFLVPITFAVTVPAQALTGRLTGSTLALAVLLAVAMFLASRWFWRFGIRFYAGASA